MAAPKWSDRDKTYVFSLTSLFAFFLQGYFAIVQVLLSNHPERWKMCALGHHHGKPLQQMIPHLRDEPLLRSRAQKLLESFTCIYLFLMKLTTSEPYCDYRRYTRMLL